MVGCKEENVSSTEYNVSFYEYYPLHAITIFYSSINGVTVSSYRLDTLLCLDNITESYSPYTNTKFGTWSNYRSYGYWIGTYSKYDNSTNTLSWYIETNQPSASGLSSYGPEGQWNSTLYKYYYIAFS